MKTPTSTESSKSPVNKQGFKALVASSSWEIRSGWQTDAAFSPIAVLQSFLTLPTHSVHLLRDAFLADENERSLVQSSSDSGAIRRMCRPSSRGSAISHSGKPSTGWRDHTASYISLASKQLELSLGHTSLSDSAGFGLPTLSLSQLERVQSEDKIYLPFLKTLCFYSFYLPSMPCLHNRLLGLPS